jgi:hypothetical protein
MSQFVRMETGNPDLRGGGSQRGTLKSLRARFSPPVLWLLRA